MLPADLQKKYKLSRLMMAELKRMAKLRCVVVWRNASIRALERRGLVMYINEEPHKEGWTLTEEGETVASQLQRAG